MSAESTRREFLAAAGAAAALSALPAIARAAGPAEPLDFASAREQVAALAERRVSATELLDRAIARIEKFDGRINAVVVRDFERARDAAKAADEALARGERRPLLGLPMTVKEAYNVAGLPTTWGLPAAKEWRPQEDAVAVARLKAAGAVILGKTNVPLFLADWQSYNDVYGTTSNPWDPGRTPGGSSGGSAAALAAGYVALEMGSDIGGSLRAPAHYCGVFSHKPSYGLLPPRGHTPPRLEALPASVDLAVIGPLARSAADLALALDLLAGPDETEAVAYRLALPPPRRSEFKGFRILVLDTHPAEPTAESVRAALGGLAEGLEKAGATVARQSPLVPDLAEQMRVYMRLLISAMSGGRPPDYYGRMEAAVAALPPGDDSLAALRLRSTILSHRDWQAASGIRLRLRRQWRDLFRDWDVVLCPAMPTPAFPHDHAPNQEARRIDIDGKDYPYVDQLAWPGVATVPGLPATTVPIGRSEAGLPIGAQIVGPFLEDRTPIALAELIEREFGGFTPPPGFAL